MEPGQIIQWVLIGVILAIVIVDKGKRIISRRNGGKNNNNPGYDTRITRLETKMENVEREVGRIRVKLDLT